MPETPQPSGFHRRSSIADEVDRAASYLVFSSGAWLMAPSEVRRPRLALGRGDLALTEKERRPLAVKSRPSGFRLAAAIARYSIIGECLLRGVGRQPVPNLQSVNPLIGRQATAGIELREHDPV